MPTYQNGRVPRSAMAQFRGTGKYGHPDFISRLDQAFTAVEHELGVHLSIAAGQDIFRDIAGQTYWKNYWTARGVPRNAAAVGYSNHGLGVCADISGNGVRGTTMWNRVAAIFARYNLHFTVASESWHVQDMNISVRGNVVAIATRTAAYSGNPSFPSIAAFKAVQGGYIALGYKLKQDGLDGPATQAVVRDFQRKNGLKPDGIHGPATELKLVAAVAAKNKGPAHRSRPTLRVGSSGKDVVDLQKILNRYHGEKLKTDGKYGTGTRDAVARVQRKLRINPDGVVGSTTWHKLGQ